MEHEAKTIYFQQSMSKHCDKATIFHDAKNDPIYFSCRAPTQRSFEIESSCHSGVGQMSRTPRQDYLGFSRRNQARCDQQSCSLSSREKHCHVFSCSSTSVVDKTGLLASGLQWLLSKQTGSYSNSLK